MNCLNQVIIPHLIAVLSFKLNCAILHCDSSGLWKDIKWFLIGQHQVQRLFFFFFFYCSSHILNMNHVLVTQRWAFPYCCRRWTRACHLSEKADGGTKSALVRTQEVTATGLKSHVRNIFNFIGGFQDLVPTNPSLLCCFSFLKSLLLCPFGPSKRFYSQNESSGSKVYSAPDIRGKKRSFWHTTYTFVLNTRSRPENTVLRSRRKKKGVKCAWETNMSPTKSYLRLDLLTSWTVTRPYRFLLLFPHSSRFHNLTTYAKQVTNTFRTESRVALQGTPRCLKQTFCSNKWSPKHFAATNEHLRVFFFPCKAFVRGSV